MMIYASDDNFVGDGYLSFDCSKDFLEYLSFNGSCGSYALKLTSGDMYRFIINDDNSIDVYNFTSNTNQELLKIKALMSFVDFETFYSLYDNF